MSKRKLISVFVCSTIIMLMLGAAMAFAWGDSEVDTEKTAVTFAREAAKGGYQIVTTDELKKWTDSQKHLLIVDTMPFEDSYKKQHIPGAVQLEFPKEEMTTLSDKMKETLIGVLGADKDRTIVFYCGFTKCGRSHNGAMWAVKLGYKNVYRYPGGIKAWAEAKYPVEAAK
ncbi:MAG: rhodanese-like domain-containing protein [Deltaproteobacteria bacterium]|nr:rhodanese-like domain-containing protein [Deltaproteobacteria bacterium]